MKFEDYEKVCGDKIASQKELSEWVLGGKHYPKVDVYHNTKTGTGYQVSIENKLYRKTIPSKNSLAAEQYGEWEEMT